MSYVAIQSASAQFPIQDFKKSVDNNVEISYGVVYKKVKSLGSLSNDGNSDSQGNQYYSRHDHSQGKSSKKQERLNIEAKVGIGQAINERA